MNMYLYCNHKYFAFAGVDRMEDINFASQLAGATVSVTRNARRARGGPLATRKY